MGVDEERVKTKRLRNRMGSLVIDMGMLRVGTEMPIESMENGTLYFCTAIYCPQMLQADEL